MDLSCSLWVREGWWHIVLSDGVLSVPSVRDFCPQQVPACFSWQKQENGTVRSYATASPSWVFIRSITVLLWLQQFLIFPCHLHCYSTLSSISLCLDWAGWLSLCHTCRSLLLLLLVLNSSPNSFFVAYLYVNQSGFTSSTIWPTSNSLLQLILWIPEKKCRRMCRLCFL